MMRSMFDSRRVAVLLATAVQIGVAGMVMAQVQPPRETAGEAPSRAPTSERHPGAAPEESPAVPDAMTASASGRVLCVHGVSTGQTLAVRAEPSRVARVIARLAADACGLRLVGRCQGSWCDMANGATRGWIDTRFVGIYEVPTETPRKALSTGTPPETRTPATPAAPEAAVPPREATAVAPSRDAPKTRSASRSTKQRAASAGPKGARVAPRPMISHGRDTGSDWWGSSLGAMLRPSDACVARVAWGDTLRIRTGPGIGHGEIGGIPPGACRIEPAGRCQGDWCRIAWRGRVGWVNARYLD